MYICPKIVLENMEEKEREDRELQNHGWFVSFAPEEDPEISVVVLVEHGGAGSRAAAPIARKIMEFYYNNIYLPRMQAQSQPSALPSEIIPSYSFQLESAFVQSRNFVFDN